MRNYLRVRGEYVGGSNTFTMWWELPPRARRILINNQLRLIHIGTTSACAENTGVATVVGVVVGNYLRVRGEYLSFQRLYDGG